MPRFLSLEGLSKSPDLEKYDHIFKVVRSSLPNFCRAYDGIAARQLKKSEPLLRELRSLTLPMIEEKLLPLLENNLEAQFDEFLNFLAQEDALDDSTLPIIFFELKNNVHTIKDNASIVKVFEGLLRAYIRRSQQETQIN